MACDVATEARVLLEQCSASYAWTEALAEFSHAERLRQQTCDGDDFFSSPLPDHRGREASSSREPSLSRAQPPSGGAASVSSKRLDGFMTLTAELSGINDAIASSALLRHGRRSREVPVTEMGVSMLPCSLHEELLLTLCDGKVAEAECRRAAALLKEGCFKEAGEVLLALECLGAPTAHRARVFLFNGAAACSFMAEDWEETVRLSQRCLELCGSFDVALRRLCRVAVVTRKVTEAQQLVQAHRRCAWWSDERCAVAELERYTALLEARCPAEAARSVERLLQLLPCGQLECLRVQLLLGEGRKAAADYAAQRLRVYPSCTELHYWRYQALLHSASSAQDLAAVRADVSRALQQKGQTSALLRLLEGRVCAAAAVVSGVDALVQGRLWDRVVTYCSSALDQHGRVEPVPSDGVVGLLYARRARAHWECGRLYQALDDAQRALSYTEDDSARADLFLRVARCEDRLHRLRDAVYHARQAVCMLSASAASAATVYLRALEARLADERDAGASCATGGNTHRTANPGTRSEKQRPRRANSDLPRSETSAAQPSPYVVLCLPSDVTDEQVVRRTYRSLAVKWHPDKWCGREPSEVRVAEAQFKLIQWAYETILARIGDTSGAQTR